MPAEIHTEEFGSTGIKKKLDSRENVALAERNGLVFADHAHHNFKPMTKFKFLGVAIAALVSNFAWAGHGPCFDMDPVACQTFSLTNVERLKANLPPVSYSPICFSMAQEQSADMADRNYFDHQRPAFPDRPAESFSQRAARFDLSRGVGENIAMAQTPAQAMELWMKSPGHRQNILNPGFRSMGVGYKSGLFTQTFSN